MKNVNCIVKIAACVASVFSLVAASQSQALVAFSIGAVGGVDPGFAPGEVSVVGFDAPNAVGVTETDSGPASSVGLFTLTDPNVAAAPMGDATQFEALQAGGSAKFNFTNYAPGVRSLSVYVGSIDMYNKFEITTNHKNYFYNGRNFLNNNGDQFSKLTNRRVYIQFTPAEVFKSITFSSSGIAFEYDNIAVEPYSEVNPAWERGGDDVDGLGSMATSPAPEPAAWSMLLAGFMIIGASIRNRRAVLAA